MKQKTIKHNKMGNDINLQKETDKCTNQHIFNHLLIYPDDVQFDAYVNQQHTKSKTASVQKCSQQTFNS